MLCKNHYRRFRKNGTTEKNKRAKSSVPYKRKSKSKEAIKRGHDRERKNLANSYIHRLLRLAVAYNAGENRLLLITPEIVEAKRIQIANRRYIKEILDGIKTNQALNNDNG